MTELIAIIIGAIFLLILINVVGKKTSQLDTTYYKHKWEEIRVLQRTSAAGKRLAIVEADKLLDHALKDIGVKGDTMGNRLKSAGKLINDQNAIWSAHKLRNRIVHEEISIKPTAVSKALASYEITLKKLGAL